MSDITAMRSLFVGTKFMWGGTFFYI